MAISIEASHSDDATYPAYTETPVYEALARIAANAGISIEYVDKKELSDAENTIGGSAGEYVRKVFMARNHDFGTPEYATFVLAHEIAHSLTNDFYSDGAHHFYHDKQHIRRFLEADADKIGSALYVLAEMTAMHEAESIWLPMDKAPEDICTDTPECLGLDKHGE